MRLDRLAARCLGLVLCLAPCLLLPACDDGGDDDRDAAGMGGEGGMGGQGGEGGMGGMGGTGGMGGMPDDMGPAADMGPDMGPVVLPDGRELTVDVSSVFAPGAAVRDAYTGALATVAADGTVTVAVPPGGAALIEAADTDPAAWPFDWDNATVYFVITDRFANGDPANDHSYGRRSDGDDEIGTWHGGDWRGLTERLDHIDALGASVLWISAPYEQVHGWVGGGSGDFRHYGYHGYWALDFTVPDANFGTGAELRALVQAAHARGIRVILDVVMNHPGYATLDDLVSFLPEVLRPGYQDWLDRDESDNWQGWNDVVDYQSLAWLDWWGNRWIRAGFPMHNGAGMTDLNRSLSYLPDFITEDFRAVPALPTLLTRKRDRETSEAVFVDGYTVRNYLVRWLTDWVRDYGIDGFRCDTAKHVELPAWAALKEAGVEALREWKAAHPGEAIGDDDFWMVGEVFPHGLQRDAYFTEGGFDALINFDFQDAARDIATDLDALDRLYASYASSLNPVPGFNVMSYISSHDTSLFFDETGESVPLQYAIGTALLLTPGAVQVFYGDETGRRAGPPSSDPVQHTRSDMNWDAYDAALLAHWQRVGAFRRRHPAVGAGEHDTIALDRDAYVFSRTAGADAVVVAIPRAAP
ncbi:MAG: alpha-amylase [Myxococcales bacterium]|nr:alpha-amylase [Myxococcales bacterium]